MKYFNFFCITLPIKVGEEVHVDDCEKKKCVLDNTTNETSIETKVKECDYEDCPTGCVRFQKFKKISKNFFFQNLCLKIFFLILKFAININNIENTLSNYRMYQLRRDQF